MNRYGFPRTGPKQVKFVQGFQTGDLIRAVVTAGVNVGTYVGRVAVRATGSFNITTRQGTVQGIGHQFCTFLHKCDGYSYGQGELPKRPGPKKGRPVSSPAEMVESPQVEFDEESREIGIFSVTLQVPSPFAVARPFVCGW